MDGLLLKINYEFLLDLKKKGLNPNDIRIKLRPRDSVVSGNRTLFTTIEDFDHFNRAYGYIINDPKFLCYAGPFPVIENIRLVNQNLSFKNIYRWYNITESKKMIREIQYDSLRKDFYESEIQRYLDLMNQSIDDYTAKINKAISVRLNAYVDPCYVDINYVDPNSN